MIDTHAHLTDSRYEDDLESVVERARSCGVTKMICPATSVSDARAVAKLSQKYEIIYGLVGVYPGEANEDRWARELAEIREILTSNNKKIVGMGEIGLDINSYKLNPKFEQTVFEDQLDLALELGCPIVVHTRGTEEQVWQTLKNYESLPSGHFHCFNGSKPFLDYILSRGFYVGFDGNVTYKSAQDLRDLAKMIPLDRLLLETDSPYLPPYGKRGERNEPGNVRITAEFLALLRGESIETLIEQTTNNAERLFGL